MKTIIHVNQHVIRRNRRAGSSEPCLTVKTYKSNTYAHEAIIAASAARRQADATPKAAK